MKTTQNTVLITGGSAGIGFQLATLLADAGNTVIITGRDAARLAHAATALPSVHTFNGDITNATDVNRLVAWIKHDFPDLNMVINNAGAASLNDLRADTDTFAKASHEMLTNYLSVIRLNELLIPLLEKQSASAIVNVSSIFAFAPGKKLASYAATKAALHSYTQSLRLWLAPSTIKVFELMPPLVNTAFSAGIGGHKGIPPAEVATAFIEALENDVYEIRVANTEAFYHLSLASPVDALSVLNE
ncbi:MAG: SDR family NAD(P)-dependent oxidoreductase [Chitinophaga sp.]|uniref:SDR family oxidoreductase n=1 Tax=Chitinophaga sp. TaxID=1869181 RepID=UPI0025C50745|nr:SDR family NAD(P)-dependent oxidoreductase [Chitinophaga sp.]MBV8252114.1 SDR family NAD(P)-dependent oxidoreductase [Chitinophaga sp.]